MNRTRLFALMSMVLSTASHADTLSEQDIYNKLLQDRQAAPAMGATRSLGGERGLSVQKAAPSTNQLGVNLQLQFEFNSSDLTAESKKSLDALAGAISKDAFKDARFSVVGHTDAVGEGQYNEALSESRANAVASYLRSAHGISPQRLNVWGEGEKNLLDASEPSSASNRRVQVYENR